VGVWQADRVEIIGAFFLHRQRCALSPFSAPPTLPSDPLHAQRAAGLALEAAVALPLCGAGV